MSNSIDPGTPRVHRREKPKGKLTRHNYRQRALPSLRIDFDNRCAYSLRHEQLAGGLEVDHFDPRTKLEYLQSYANLFPAIRSCNGKKADFWPSAAETAKGIRFLNCCEEQDYGAHIFEDPKTHEVFGVTPARKYHVRVLDLNAPYLVNERHVRDQLRKAMSQTVAQVTRRPSRRGGVVPDLAQVWHLVGLLRNQLDLMIQPIEFRDRAA